MSVRLIIHEISHGGEAKFLPAIHSMERNRISKNVLIRPYSAFALYHGYCASELPAQS